jgi:predicted amidohydrolase
MLRGVGLNTVLEMATHRVLAAVAQLTSVPSVETNIRVVVDVVRRAGAAGAKVLFLPEASDLSVRFQT